jgi:hypothetical protein
MYKLILLLVLLIGCPEYKITIEPAKKMPTKEEIIQIQSTLKHGETLLKVNDLQLRELKSHSNYYLRR